MLDPNDIRNGSLRQAQSLGFPVNRYLPVCDRPQFVRDQESILQRLLAMHVLAATAYGFDRHRGLAWLEQERLTDNLLPYERDYLCGQPYDISVFDEQIEGMWALAWCLQIVPELRFDEPCADDFVFNLPDLTRNEGSESMRKKVNLRLLEEMFAALDLAYCLRWGLRDCQLQGHPIPLEIRACVIVERHRALEWVFEDADWSEITLDT